MGFRFRLTFHHMTRGFFRFGERSNSFPLDESTQATLTARDADTLDQATRFHLEVSGFTDTETARIAGERLRLRLRILNSVLGLGLAVPTVDTTSARLSSTAKESELKATGRIVLDSIVGLAVFPDCDKYVESVIAGTGNVHPSDPSYLFRALAQIWSIEMHLDQCTEDALEILGRATIETSQRARFLLTYLAAERIVDRASRSDAAIRLLEEFQERVRSSGLDKRDADSLCGSLAQLRTESFRSALFALAARIQDPLSIQGKPLREFLSECVDARNALAHDALGSKTNLHALSDGLREFVMRLIWTTRHIPPVFIQVPASTISMDGMAIRLL